MVPYDPQADGLSADASAAVRALADDGDSADPEATVLRLLVLRLADARGRLDTPVRWSETDGLSDRAADAWRSVSDRVPTGSLPVGDWPGDASLAVAVGHLEARAAGRTRRDFAALDPRHVGTVHEALMVDDRKTAGAYYTPFPVVRYVVEATVDPLLDAVERGDRHVTDLAVLDPATGCGRFLVETVLVCRNRLVDCGADGACDDVPFGDGATYPESDALTDVLVSNCVYGVDLDGRALDVTMLVTWLATDASADALVSLCEHLHVGDALLGRAGPGEPPVDDLPSGKPTLDWPEAFPAVRGEGKRFDAAVGNPPYVRSRTIPDETKARYREAYATASGAFDLYVPFVERAATLADRVGVVVPNKWTTTKYGRSLRDRLLDDHRISEVVDLSSLDVFDDAAVYPLVLRFSSGSGPTRDLTITTPTDATAIDDAPRATLPRNIVDGLGDRVVPTEVDPDTADVVARLAATGSRLGDHATAAEGVHTGNVRERLVVDEPTPDAVPVVGGDCVEPYRVESNGRYLRTDPDLVDENAGEYADLRDPSLFAGSKLLVPDVARWPTAAYDTAGRYALNTLYVVRPRAGSPYGLWQLLAILNSSLVRWYFQQVYGGTHVSGGYLRCKPMFLLELPIPPSPDPALLDRLSRAAKTAYDIRTDRASLEPSLSPTFDQPAGPTLADAGAVAVANGPFTGSTDEFPKLRIGDVSVRRIDGESVELQATVRYKPADCQDTASEDVVPGTDRWGYIETDARPAIRLRCGERLSTLVEAFVPIVVDRDDGFGGFRSRAAKSISPVDRLMSIRLPDPEAYEAELDSFRRARDRASALDETIAETDRRIDDAIARLYGVSPEYRTLFDASPGD